MWFYVFYTWLIVAIICPFVALIGAQSDKRTAHETEFNVFLYFIGGFGYFIPWLAACVILSRFAITAALAVKADPFGNFLLWIVLSAAVVFANGILFGLITHTPVDELLWYLWYVIVSVWIASMIRYKYFLKLVKPNDE